MTDNEIIKALDCCSYGSEFKCQECPANDCSLSCDSKLAKKALDLINRQNAEIEKLNVELVGMRGACESYKIHYDNAQAEIERLQKEKFDSLNCQFAEMYATTLKIATEKAKSEAYREFAKRLKWYVTVAESKPTSRLSYSSLGIVNMIDLVYNELTRNLHGTCTESNE